MYYLSPFYHEIFPEMDRLIMLDCDLGKNFIQSYSSFSPESVIIKCSVS